VGVLLPGRSAIQIWRKLLDNVSGHIDTELNSELPGAVCRCSIVRDIGIGDCNRSGIPQDFRKIELGSAVVAVSDEDLPH